MFCELGIPQDYATMTRVLSNIIHLQKEGKDPFQLDRFSCSLKDRSKAWALLFPEI